MLFTVDIFKLKKLSKKKIRKLYTNNWYIIGQNHECEIKIN